MKETARCQVRSSGDKNQYVSASITCKGDGVRREKEERRKGHGQLNKVAIAWAMRLTRCKKEAERQRST